MRLVLDVSVLVLLVLPRPVAAVSEERPDIVRDSLINTKRVVTRSLAEWIAEGKAQAERCRTQR